MILIFGGTTEGRIAAKVSDAAGKPFFYSSKNSDQDITGEHIHRIHGAMDADDITAFCQQKGISLLIDAAHPFASLLHQNIAQAAQQLNIPCLRLERPALSLKGDGIKCYGCMEEALEALPPQSRVLALTGVKSAPLLASQLSKQKLWLRIMDRAESHRMIDACGFPCEALLYYPEGGESVEELCTLIQEKNITALICKESGQSGGLHHKIEATQRCQCPLSIIRRPSLPPFTATLYGEHGLRRAIQQALPTYYPLKTGLTTGSYATAASCAALYALIHQKAAEGVSITLPDGEPLQLPISSCRYTTDEAEARFTKDSGDDPCVIHGLELGACLRLLPKEQGIVLKGGEGVGHATLPGLDFPIGAPAINKVPRAMIQENLQRLLQEEGLDTGLEVEIFIPHGEEVAQKTLNSRLGIIGGLSILGTSGIVQPFSAEAFLASIERQIHILQALHHKSIALNSGAKSEQSIRGYLPHLDPICFLHYGNLIGDSLKICAKADMEEVHLGLMIGKAVKLAQGHLDTRNQRCRMDIAHLLQLAQEAHCSTSTLEAIAGIRSARELWDTIPQAEEAFFHRLAERCHSQASRVFPAAHLRVLLIAEGGKRIIPFPPQKTYTIQQ